MFQLPRAVGGVPAGTSSESVPGGTVTYQGAGMARSHTKEDDMVPGAPTAQLQQWFWRGFYEILRISYVNPGIP